MDWQSWLMLALGLAAGGGLGFAIGRYLVPAPPVTRALEKEDAAERKADTARENIEADLRAKDAETEAADARKLKELLDADFSDVVRSKDPGGGPTGGI